MPDFKAKMHQIRFHFVASVAFKQLRLKENVCGKQVMNKIGTITTARPTPQSINQFTNDSVKCSNVEHQILSVDSQENH